MGKGWDFVIFNLRNNLTFLFVFFCRVLVSSALGLESGMILSALELEYMESSSSFRSASQYGPVSYTHLDVFVDDVIRTIHNGIGETFRPRAGNGDSSMDREVVLITDLVLVSSALGLESGMILSALELEYMVSVCLFFD
ncbi:hypothetical protein GLOIN_2v1777726 [Rhizophagus irregularis DAOM 181602=DAOM 197198]|uniref:Uncharacterized protein n=1 Tax=Rhizophagus irregularis (strain DAOM 181602 / DAOM 197198 / MUCL 43194) TaxID=747089 RepID=A0A2P4PU45_RHIID|nr:hypothetical protein GLOIN_2v1777726 [Rhizophagus irregularis DAOM 181602=DAOM 197198]POG68907.1 hypothetical protein GLOIN_2v1777726 [Rhizophagus irregularis DAOM 181602=DAOM 197198]|eukprot:XP_025175773.1 hypothetical protein GLOIN_2v1777726 [Rhizophagus irregularis DAOM 181602=DAOM 197198]